MCVVVFVVGPEEVSGFSSCNHHIREKPTALPILHDPDGRGGLWWPPVLVFTLQRQHDYWSHLMHTINKMRRGMCLILCMRNFVVRNKLN